MYRITSVIMFFLLSSLILAGIVIAASADSAPAPAKDAGKAVVEIPDFRIKASQEQLEEKANALAGDYVTICNNLMEQLTDKNTPPEGKVFIVKLLGKYHAVNAASWLADNIDLPGVLVYRGVYEFLPPEPPFVVSALINIGKPGSLECLKHLYVETTETPRTIKIIGPDGKVQDTGTPVITKRELYLQVIRGVEGDDVARFMLQNAIEKEQDKDKKANLTAALALLDKWIKEDAERAKQINEKADAPAEKPATPDKDAKPVAKGNYSKLPAEEAERAKKLELKLRSCLKGEPTAVKVFRLPEAFLKETSAKITNARTANELSVITHYDLPRDKQVTIELEIFETPDAAIEAQAGRFAMSMDGYIDKFISDKYGDACFAHPEAITFLRGNVVVEVRGKDPEAVDKAAKEFDAAIQASANLPATADGAKFDYPKEFLTENATKQPAFPPKEDPHTSFVHTWSIAFFDQLATFVSNYTKNWDKETDASRAAFCELAGKARMKDAVALLVEHMDYSYATAGPAQDILKDMVALKALIEIGMPALEPAVQKLLKESEKLPLPETDESKAQKTLLNAALKALTTQILGKDLAVSYINIKLNDKGLTERGKATLQSVLASLNTEKTSPKPPSGTEGETKPAPEKPAPPGAISTGTDNKEVGYTFEIRSLQETYIPGEPVVLDLSVKNTSAEDIRLVTPSWFEGCVQLTVEGEDTLPVKKKAPMVHPGGITGPGVFAAKPGQTAHLSIILDKWYVFLKPGVYKGSLTVKMEGHADLTAPFQVTVVNPLEQVAIRYYQAWSDAREKSEGWQALELLTYVRSNYAIKYLENVAFDAKATDETRASVCGGLVRIETRESAESLARLAESDKLPKAVSDYCKARAVNWYKATTNEDIKKALKGIADKYPNATIPMVGD